MRLQVSISSCFALIFLLTGCFSEPEDRLGARLEGFLSILDSQEKAFVDSAEYGQAAKSLKNRLATSKELESRYHKLLNAENIEFFDVEHVLQFFDGSIRARAKLFRFVAFLNKEEVLAFNERRFADLARSLETRFSADPALQQTYRREIAPRLKDVSDNELSIAYVIERVVRPYAELYAVMTQDEREMLSGSEADKAARQLAVRMVSEPTVQKARAAIQARLPETRNQEVAARVFEAAAALSLKDRTLRTNLSRMAGWILAMSEAGVQADNRSLETAFTEELRALAAVAPGFTAALKRQMLIERELAWFGLVVEEKLDFFTGQSRP